MSTPQNGIRKPKTIGVNSDAQIGTRAVRFMMYGCRKNPSTTTTTAYRMSTYNGCSQSCQRNAAASTGPSKPSTGPMCGTTCSTAARNAQNGAQGTFKIASPIHHSTPTAMENCSGAT